MTLNYPKKSNGMYIIRKDQFDDIATAVLSEYAPQNLQRPMPLDIDYFISDCLYITQIYRYLSYNAAVLGMMAFGDVEVPCLDSMFNPGKLAVAEGTMLVDSSLMGHESLPRNRFTKAHEVSHWILHRCYHSPDHKDYDLRTAKTRYIACRKDAIERPRYGSYKVWTENDWEEWQADRLGASLLMPRDTFTEAAHDAFRHNDVRHGYLVKGQNMASYIGAVEEISGKFVVSKKAAEIRLQQLGMLFDSESEVYNRYYR